MTSYNNKPFVSKFYESFYKLKINKNRVEMKLGKVLFLIKPEFKLFKRYHLDGQNCI